MLSIFFDKKTKANLKYNFSFFIPLVKYNYDEKIGNYAYITTDGQYILNGSKTSNLKVKARFTNLSGISGKLIIKLKYYGLYIWKIIIERIIFLLYGLLAQLVRAANL